MKELLSRYITEKYQFKALERETEEKFSKFLSEIPFWKERVKSIMTVYGSSAVREEKLIPQVRNLEFFSNDRISFEIRVPSDTWVPRYIGVNPFPFDLLTSDPESLPDYTKYVKAKIARRERCLKNLEEDMEGLKENIEKTRGEITKLRSCIKKEN